MNLDASNFENCLARIAAAGGRTARDAGNILHQVHARGEELRQAGAADPYVAAAQELSDRVQAAARQTKLDALRNTAVRQARIAEASKGGIATAAQRLRSRLYWTPGDDPKGNAQTLGRALTNDWLSVMQAQLQKSGLVKVAASPEMFEPVARELQNVRARVGTLDATSPARRIAEIIAPIQEAMRKRLNAEGAHIADAQDWIATTSHDGYLMRRGGRGLGARAPSAEEAFQRWWGVVEPRLAEKTFDDVEPEEGESMNATRQRFGRDVFDALVTGVHMNDSASAAGSYVPAAFEGSSNIARKISQGRVLFWRDPTAWSEYMRAYGKPQSWYELMTNAATQAGRRAGLMHFWGTNPAGNLALVVRRLEEGSRRDIDGVAKFQADVKGGITQPPLDQVMAQLDGRANVPQSEMWHAIGSTVRAFYNMVYLGFVAGTHASSLVSTFPSEARMHGVNSFSALGGVMSAMVKRLSAPERADALSDLGAYGDGVSRHAFNALGHGWNIPGLIAAADSRFMTATGLPHVFEHASAGMREMLAHNLGRRIDGEFGSLEPVLQRALQGYGIGPDEWALLRSGGVLHTPDGKDYLTPRSGLDADPGAVETLLRSRGTIAPDAEPDAVARAVVNYQQDLADRLMMYYGDAADHATVTVGVRERAFLQGGARPGSLQAELMNSLLQFKTWPLAALHQVIGRQFYDSLSRKSAMWGIGGVLGLSMLGGYIRMTARDLLYGDEPRVPRSIGEAKDIALAALAQGGGLGIFGDMFFGEANRFGVGNLTSVGGPMVTDAAQLYGIYNRWLGSIGTDQKFDVWPALARWGLSHVPGANLFYLKGAADYLLFYHLFEAMNPGWWERTNRRMQRQQGRTMLGYAPGAGVPFVPWGQGEAQAYVAR